jgi:ADP-heptose:LPS heptosyltransferase
MGGSALNASDARYAQWVETLRTWFPDTSLLLSEGPSAIDKQMIDGIRKRFPEIPVLEKVELDVLREIFRMAMAVIAPSTGPLHLAHAVGTPTLGVFSPVKSHRATRWAPWGGVGRKHVLVPKVDCPGTRDCLGAKCPQFPCMDRIELDRSVRDFFDAKESAARVGLDA